MILAGAGTGETVVVLVAPKLYWVEVPVVVTSNEVRSEMANGVVLGTVLVAVPGT